ncbi:MAG: MotA/TolQ/ExbB proton channel family protein [Epsilonproteobacteria bacterium]|nr:MotA/TolQ/ExbB proton channel family protein [Campylobacterota bacterium]
MGAIDLFLNYLSRSSIVTIAVLVWLSFYFILTFWIIIYRYLYLNSLIKKEEDSLEAMLMGSATVRADSILRKCTSQYRGSSSIFDICVNIAEKQSTSYLSALSIISSTSPFIGLFGTVVGILETFSKLSGVTTASLNIIAPAISEALVATAGGILVAVPAYSGYIILKRKAYEYLSVIDREKSLLLSTLEKSTDN